MAETVIKSGTVTITGGAATPLVAVGTGGIASVHTVISAPSGNAADVYVGGTSVKASTKTGAVLAKGTQMVFPFRMDLSAICVDGTTSDIVGFWYIPATL